jgi:hypothetical protein
MHPTKDKRVAPFIESARQKRLDGAGLTVKEWCALAGYGYDQGLAMSHQPGFPTFNGRIVWEDWTAWRRIKLGLVVGPRSQNVGAPRSAPVNKSGERAYQHD